MAIALRGTQTALNTTTVNKVTGVVNDDLMITSVIVYDNTVTITPPAGWALAGENTIAGSTATKHAVYYKKASSEGASYTFSNSGGAYTDLLSIAYSGVDTTTAMDATATTNTGTSGTPTITGITTATANAQLVLCLSGYNNDAGAVSGMTTRIGPFDSVNYIYDKSQAGAGASGSFTATSSSDGWIFVLLALREAGGAPSSPVGPIIGGKLTGHSILQGRLIR